MATSLQDLPNIEDKEITSDIDDFVPETADNSYKPKKHVSFNDEVDYEPENVQNLTMMETIYQNVKGPFLVLILVFMVSNPYFTSLISKIPVINRHQNTMTFSIGIAVIVSSLYYVFNEHVM